MNDDDIQCVSDDIIIKDKTQCLNCRKISLEMKESTSITSYINEMAKDMQNEKSIPKQIGFNVMKIFKLLIEKINKILEIIKEKKDNKPFSRKI